MPTSPAASTLPPIDQLREMVDIYFARIHTVRCLGFMHIPSFMTRFNQADRAACENSGLIYIMCALAVPFYYVNSTRASDEGSESNIRVSKAGQGWAATAMQHVLSNFANPSVECLMAEVLLHEYHLRTGDYTSAFFMSGIITRQMQLLQLNTESDSHVTGAQKESRRRLFWACYLLDASIECGIDQLRLISPVDIQVQLPCLEDLFVRSATCVTEMLPTGELPPTADPSLRDVAADHLDLRAFYIRATFIRSKVLRYVKHLEGDVPWADSQFHRLDEEIQALEGSIPGYFRMCIENTYLFKASGRLNLYFGLHILISQTYNDLYRVGVPHLVFPNTATKWIRDNAPESFTIRCYRVCACKAVDIASMLEDLWQCDRQSLVDIPYAAHVQVCSCVLATIVVSWNRSEPLLSHLSYRRYQELLESNVKILQYLQQYMDVDVYREAAVRALKRFNAMFSGQLPAQQGIGSSVEESMADRPDQRPQFSLEYILNPLGTYPFARKELHKRRKHDGIGVEGPPTAEPAHVGRSNPAAAIGSPNGEGLRMRSSDVFTNHIFEWGPEMLNMGDIAYPAFLDLFTPGFEDAILPTIDHGV